MKLELGKRYIRRDGEITDPLKDNGHSSYTFYDPKGGLSYSEGGLLFVGAESNLDLDAEYIEPEHAEYTDKEDAIEKAIVKLKHEQSNGDIDDAHANADKIICQLLIDLGYAEVVFEYNKVEKWYS